MAKECRNEKVSRMSPYGAHHRKFAIKALPTGQSRYVERFQANI